MDSGSGRSQHYGCGKIAEHQNVSTVDTTVSRLMTADLTVCQPYTLLERLYLVCREDTCCPIERQTSELAMPRLAVTSSAEIPTVSHLYWEFCYARLCSPVCLRSKEKFVEHLLTRQEATLCCLNSWPRSECSTGHNFCGSFSTTALHRLTCGASTELVIQIAFAYPMQ